MSVWIADSDVILQAPVEQESFLLDNGNHGVQPCLLQIRDGHPVDGDAPGLRLPKSQVFW